MASIVQRNNRFVVVYMYTAPDGKRKQKWETFKTMAEAKERKRDVEYKESMGAVLVPECKNLKQLLKEYVSIHGKSAWALSTYQSNVALIDHYIIPYLGEMQLKNITPRVVEKYYQQLLKTPAVPNALTKRPKNEFVSTGTVKNIHKLLRSCFAEARKWELMEKNPCELATVPKHVAEKRQIWDAETLFKALSVCQDERLALSINLAFSCSLRLGELLGLTWDCIDISDEAVNSGSAYVFVNKEVQRVNKTALASLNQKDVIHVFPSVKKSSTTTLVLKTPKTASSIRKVFLPKTVAEMLQRWKENQNLTKETLGIDYEDYDLVICGAFGQPLEGNTITTAFERLISENNLPPVVFHSLRHSSITYKLKLNGGDIKAVQGDSGHSQAKMVTDQYSHILDEDRRNNARLFENAFYNPSKGDTEGSADGISSETLAKLLADPTMRALLTTLAKSLEQ